MVFIIDSRPCEESVTSLLRIVYTTIGMSYASFFDTFYTYHALPSKKLVKFKFQSSEPYHGHTQTPIVSLKITYFIILNPASSVYDIFEIFHAHFFDHGFSANFTGPNQAVRAP